MMEIGIPMMNYIIQKEKQYLVNIIFEGLSTCDLLDIRDSINKEIQNRENELL